MGEREAHQLQCKPQSAQCSEKQQSPCEGEGGGLKFEKKKCLKKIKPTPKKKVGIGSPVFCTVFFIHPQPDNVGPARQQPRALFLISLSLVGGG